MRHTDESSQDPLQSRYDAAGCIPDAAPSLNGPYTTRPVSRNRSVTVSTPGNDASYSQTPKVTYGQAMAPIGLIAIAVIVFIRILVPFGLP